MSELPSDLTGVNRWAARAKRTGVAAGIAVFVITGLYGGYLLWDRVDWTPETEGTIFVETPQVYTRERLVNDRFVQESWLRSELEAKPAYGPSETATTTSRRAIGVRTAPAGSGASPNAPAPADQSGPANADQATGRAAPGIPPSVDFLLRNAHRELVRAHLIENQLDDRHDIRGTTIYMLKFDASVLPGNNTRKAAFVRVGVTQDAPSSDPRKLDTVVQKYLQLGSDEPPAADPELADDFALYSDWRRSLRDRFNSQFSGILRRFTANEFRYAEYYEMMTSLDRDPTKELFVSQTNSLAKLQAEREILGRQRRDERFLGDLDHSFHFAAKSILSNAAEKKPLPTFKWLIEVLKNRVPTEPIKPPESQITKQNPLYAALLKYAVQRFGKVVLGDNSLRLRDLRPDEMKPDEIANSPTALAAQSRTLDPFVSIALAEDAKNGHIQPEIDVDARELFLVAFDAAEVETIYQNKCLGPNGQDLQEAFEKNYSLMGQYRESGRNVRVFNVTIGRDGHPYPQSLLPIKISTPEAFKQFFSATYDTPAAAPFDSCLKFARMRVLDVGWLNFVAGILDMQTYTYATFPRYDALVTDSTFDASRAEALAVDLQTARTSGEMSNHLRQVARMVESKPSVVGFSGICNQPIPSRKPPGAIAQQPAFCSNIPASDDLNFGWALYPPTQAGSRYGGNISYRPMPPTQRSLSALITVPSYWKRAKLKVETGWLDNNGSFVFGHSHPYAVTLPLDYEALDTILVGPARRDNQRPSIAIERLPDNIEVEACQRAEILIPGRRLWRSTVVVLGGQRANEVLVLPDMRGIIATFHKIAPRGGSEEIKAISPGSPEETKISPRADPEETKISESATLEDKTTPRGPPGEAVTERELQVWTSEGVAPPLQVLVRGPAGACPTGTTDARTAGTTR
jgi:hypothetical protein